MKVEKQKVVLVTGGGQGIGLSSANIFAKNGFTVVIADVNDEQAKQSALE